MRFLCSAELVGSQLAYAVSWANVSREACLLGCPTKLVNGLQMGYNLLVNGVYWGYNRLTKFLLTSWDIQVGKLQPL